MSAPSGTTPPPIDLFCFPFAGGGSASYRDLGACLHGVAAVTTLELPGHGARYSEPPLDRFEPMVDDLHRQIVPRLRGPYALFGHSLGACLAHALARRLAHDWPSPPRFLFVSGRRGPSSFSEERRHLLPRREFFEMLRELGGCPPEVLANEEIMDLCEPALRADFAAIAAYRYQEAPPLCVPILAMIGTEDDVPLDAALHWQRETTSPLRFAEFRGDHFFIFRHWPTIARLMTDCLTAAAPCEVKS